MREFSLKHARPLRQGGVNCVVYNACLRSRAYDLTLSLGVQSSAEDPYEISGYFITNNFDYCPATVDCHDIEANNAGNQLLFGNQLLLSGNQLYTQGNSNFSRVHYNGVKFCSL